MEERVLAKMLARPQIAHVFLGHHVVQSYTVAIAVWVKVGKVQFSDISFQLMLEASPSFLCPAKK